MARLIDETFLPAMLTAPPMTDQQFADFCAGHPDLFFEMTAEGQLIVMPLNFTLTGNETPKSTGNCDPGPNKTNAAWPMILVLDTCCRTERADPPMPPGSPRAK